MVPLPRPSHLTELHCTPLLPRPPRVTPVPLCLRKDRSGPHSAIPGLGKAFALPAQGLLGRSVRSRYQMAHEVTLKGSKSLPHSLLIYTCVPGTLVGHL